MGTQHTPGPWQIDGTSGGAYRIGHARGLLTWIGEIIPLPGGEADAHLIAAAPDLFDAVKRLHDMIDKADRALELLDFIAALEQAKAAIAKAEGRAP